MKPRCIAPGIELGPSVQQVDLQFCNGGNSDRASARRSFTCSARKVCLSERGSGWNNRYYLSKSLSNAGLFNGLSNLNSSHSVPKQKRTSFFLYPDTALGGVTDGPTKFNIATKKKKKMWLALAWCNGLGTIFCGCQQFSLCTASGLREILAMSITASLCRVAAGGFVWPPLGTLRSSFHYGHWLRDWGALHHSSAHH